MIPERMSSKKLTPEGAGDTDGSDSYDVNPVSVIPIAWAGLKMISFSIQTRRPAVSRPASSSTSVLMKLLTVMPLQSEFDLRND